MADLTAINGSLANYRGLNALTIDVEDYYQVSAFEPYVNRSAWRSYECRLKSNMDRILEAMESAGVKGTFFFLGWLAERYPELPRRVSELGYEIASHGYQHVQVSHQDRNEFRQDVDRTKKILEDVSGSAVVGYRAASFSIAETNDWARDILAETGHRYSSSIYPIRHDRYGMHGAPRFACRLGSSGVVELPVTTVDLFGRRLPAGGGGYFRLLPYFWAKWSISRVNSIDSKPAIFYFHPWELDPNQPRITGIDLRTKFRHYVNLKGTEKKLRRLLSDFRWTTVASAFKEEIESL